MTQVSKTEFLAHLARWPARHQWSGHGEPYWSTSLAAYTADRDGSSNIAHISRDALGRDAFYIQEPGGGVE